MKVFVCFCRIKLSFGVSRLSLLWIVINNGSRMFGRRAMIAMISAVFRLSCPKKGLSVNPNSNPESFWRFARIDHNFRLGVPRFFPTKSCGRLFRDVLCFQHPIPGKPLLRNPPTRIEFSRIRTRHWRRKTPANAHNSKFLGGVLGGKEEQENIKLEGCQPWFTVDKRISFVVMMREPVFKLNNFHWFFQCFGRTQIK